MFALRDIDAENILKEVTDVLQVGYGEVSVIIQDHRVLDIIPAPRKRVKEALERTTQSGSSNGRMA